MEKRHKVMKKSETGKSNKAETKRSQTVSANDGSKKRDAMAELEHGKKDRDQDVIASAKTDLMKSQIDIEDEMVGFYHTIDSAFSSKGKRIIQFMGSRDAEGTTTLIREFAKISAVIFGKSVLLLDSDLHQNSSILTPKEQEDNLMSFINGRGAVNRFFNQVDDSSLFVGPVSKLGSSLSIIFNSPHISKFIDKLKDQFDLVLVDSPPANRSFDGVAVSRYVDGVVLVVKAETTRWPIVDNLKDKINKVGGNVLGVILNKQKYYIPSLIYQMI